MSTTRRDCHSLRERKEEQTSVFSRSCPCSFSFSLSRTLSPSLPIFSSHSLALLVHLQGKPSTTMRVGTSTSLATLWRHSPREAIYQQQRRDAPFARGDAQLWEWHFAISPAILHFFFIYHLFSSNQRFTLFCSPNPFLPQFTPQRNFICFHYIILAPVLPLQKGHTQCFSIEYV